MPGTLAAVAIQGETTMTSHGKWNLYGMLLLPLCATLAALIFFGWRTDTLVAVFGLNLVPMLIAAPVSGLLLLLTRRASPGVRWLAVSPTVVPAALGSLWYLGRALVPAAVAPGAEYIAGPQYLLMGVLLLVVIALVGCLAGRRSAVPA